MEIDMDNGFDTAPVRYTGHGRETIDRIRDELGDDGFRAFCVGNAMKYEDRAGRKGDPEGDADKARWYRQMAAHVDGKGPDPRAGREGFVGYARDLAGKRRNCWTCRFDKSGCWRDGVEEWIDNNCTGERVGSILMPAKDADNCPGHKFEGEE